MKRLDNRCQAQNSQTVPTNGRTDRSNTSGDGGGPWGEENKLNVLPGTKGTSWPWASLSRTIMTRGVAPDHVPCILKLTVLASLGVNLGEKRYEIQQVSDEFSS